MKRALLALLLLSACQSETVSDHSSDPAYDPAAHEADVRQWKENRDSRLRREDGWLTLVGLHWLEEGPNSIGSSDANAIVLPPKAPPLVGTLRLENEAVTLEPAEGAPLLIDGEPVTSPLHLQDDTTGNPTIVHAGGLNFQVIRRGDRFGVRVKDPKADTLVNFRGLEYYPLTPRWRVVSRFEPYQPPKKASIQDVTGLVSEQTIPGALAFEVDGKTYRLDAIAEDDAKELFIIFRDETSRDTTYPAGRYLYVPRPDAEGKVVVDFNKAYSPPCVFTPFATCPLPPPQNRLPFRIEAGEKNYKPAAKPV